MNQKSMPNFQTLEAVLQSTSLKMHPSEVHGIISGVLSGNPKEKTIDWEKMVTGDEDPPETHEVLQELFDASAKQLDEFLFEFQLLLPTDSEELPKRAEALTLWCQGYLTGLKFAGVQLIGREPSEVTEAINDIVEIAKMNYEEVVASEEDEAAYIELVEYVRMAVILIFQDIHEDEHSAKSMSNHLH